MNFFIAIYILPAIICLVVMKYASFGSKLTKLDYIGIFLPAFNLFLAVAAILLAGSVLVAWIISKVFRKVPTAKPFVDFFEG